MSSGPRWTIGCPPHQAKESDRRLLVKGQDPEGRDRRGRERRGRRRGSRRGRQEGRGRGRGRRWTATRRPTTRCTHVPAQDGVGVASPHREGEGRDRQADRGRRAARVLQVVLWRHSSVAIEEILELGDKHSWKQKDLGVKEVVKDADERGRRVRRGSWHIERVCKVIDKDSPALEGAGEGRREAERQGRLRSRRARSTAEARSPISSKRSSMRFEEDARFNKKQIDKIVLKLKELVERIERGQPAGSSGCEEHR